MPGEALRILGVDTSLRSTGYGVIAVRGLAMEVLEYGVVRCAASWPVSRCLARIAGELGACMERSRPDEVAFEGIFYCRSVRTALRLGEARGAAMTACVSAGVDFFEYPPRQVKLAVVGFGAAAKSQVGRMIMAMLGLKEPPPEDAADALAIALCHAQHRRARAVKPPRTL